MSTPTTSNGINANSDSNPTQEIAVLTQTSDDAAVSSLGQKQRVDSSGMTVSSVIPIAVKPVDSKSLQGSYAGDHRIPARDGVTSAMDGIRNAPGPRGETTDSETEGA